jgi:pimeloyl-ACP methyl ester carboxylesterase
MMMSFMLAAGAASASAATSAETVVTQTVPAPLTFYSSAPSGWQKKEVGTLLKYERESNSWPCLSGLRGYRIMYVSRGALGQKVFETGMVYIPTSGSVPKAGRPLVAWDHGTSGVGDSAAPSRYPWLYPEPVGDEWDVYAEWVGDVGTMGYIVVCPDYEGLGTPGLHTYLNAGAEGRATIDAVRAARALAAKLGVRASTRWAVTGHSQGGQAALASAEMASTYGSELSLRATVAVAPAVEMPTIIPASALSFMGAPYAGYTAWGIRAIDPGFDFSTFCGPWLLPVVDQAKDLYFDEWWGLVISAHLDADGNPLDPAPGDALRLDWDQSASVQTFLAAAAVPKAKAAGSVMVIQGTYDDFYATLPTLVDKLTAVGDDFKVVELPGETHDTALTVGWPYAEKFLAQKLPLN